ncbi:carbohydrate-binding family 9-like protein [[Flexibacter] sp. ATCC 35208]|uniref:carbohydrate-binding family 9-like protein n=1 Tax=[Flexibacter] sp. ATCC 35208 TaxID=1936242 RepID=UPI0009D46993|nr:carbohydrate-binding family 9-like protein [[Flexibacter] sp. ATCC 35208]OMP78759.1 carbohydrate-binding family 9-like protein [[Flexibacter] sp. ATCC 35208]
MSQLIRHVIAGLGLACLSLPSYAQKKAAYLAPRQYQVYQTTTPIKLDGKPDEAAWQKAEWSQDFTDIEGDKQPAPAMRTRLKMLWDQDHLYILAELEDANIWATLHQHDTIIYHDNDFEIFVDPDGDTHQYFELEINPYNTVMDLFMPKPYRENGDALMNWDAQGMRTATHIDGTLNKPGDKDKKWTVEMSIPFSAFGFFNQHIRMKDSTIWRINFSRVEWDTDIVNGKYVKRKDKITGKPLPEHNWVWSPQGIINMHAPEKWGYLFFVQKPVGSTPVKIAIPAIEEAKENLWEVYHQQNAYHQSHGRYASSLSDLGITETTFTAYGITYTLSMEAISGQFTATISDKTGAHKASIDQEGKVTTKKH